MNKKVFVSLFILCSLITTNLQAKDFGTFYVSLLIDFKAPKLISFNEYNSEVIIPDGLLSNQEVITMNTVFAEDLIPPFVNGEINGNVFEFNVFNIVSAVKENKVFTQPVEIKIPYYSDRNKVSVYYLDETVQPNIWRNDGVSIVSVNTVQNYVIFSVNHFTKFAVIEINDVSAPHMVSIKANNSLIVTGSVLPGKPRIDLVVNEMQIGDAGLSTYNIELRFEQTHQIIKQVSGNLNGVTANVNVSLDLKDVNFVPGIKYELTYTFMDMAPTVNVLQGVIENLTVPSNLFVNNFYVAPNPINIDKDLIHITYYLSKDADVRIKVYSISGELVYDQIVDSLHSKFGQNDVVWNGVDNFSEKLANGVYFVYLLVNSDGEKVTKTFKMAVLR